MKYKIVVSSYPWVMFTFIEICTDYTFEFAYLFNDVEINLSTKEKKALWYIHDAMSEDERNTYIKDLPSLSEEELFQESLVWDHIIPFEAVLKIQELAKSGNYEQGIFKEGELIL